MVFFNPTKKPPNSHRFLFRNPKLKVASHCELKASLLTAMKIFENISTVKYEGFFVFNKTTGVSFPSRNSTFTETDWFLDRLWTLNNIKITILATIDIFLVTSVDILKAAMTFQELRKRERAIGDEYFFNKNCEREICVLLDAQLITVRPFYGCGKFRAWSFVQKFTFYVKGTRKDNKNR